MFFKEILHKNCCDIYIYIHTYIRISVTTIYWFPCPVLSPHLPVGKILSFASNEQNTRKTGRMSLGDNVTEDCDCGLDSLTALLL